MAIRKVHNFKKVLAQVLLLALPTAVLIFYLLWRLNMYYAILENHWEKQGFFFLAGTVLAIVFYAFRFRFITTAIVLFLALYVLYKGIGMVDVTEFDSFYFSVQFLVFSILFCCGWLAGYGFSRSRYFTIFWAVLLLVIQVAVVSKTADITASALISAFVPVLAYAFYIIYTAELIRNMNEEDKRFGWFLGKRLVGFALVLLILFLVLFNVFQSNFKSIEKEWGGLSKAEQGKGTDKSESMTGKDKNGGISNKDQTKLSGSLNKDKELVFVARLDNFLHDGKTPNPLYFTSFYFTKFDTATQTFERDPNIPHNDLFEPDPSKIPLYFKKTDPDVIKNSLATRNRKVVTAEVYKANLAASEFLAPSTAFFCQPISVPNEQKKNYRSAYMAKMWVSELNSAYFIYNPAGNKELEQFQELRFELLREIKNIKGPDAAFMKYYTYMPRDEEYNKIGELARKITKHAYTPIDKIIALRDYFLSKDEFGLPLFKYSDNPGIPGMPSANKLCYFLFENRKGYCAYFAGATLFMLRSLGIPSRVAAGFSITDRSNKNPGWYWFYRDQAHAWVQVYFDEFGWIDFDTTIPDVNTQQASQPDGTPPENMLQTYMVADGEILNIDQQKKRLTMRVEKLLYHDTDYVSKKGEELLADVSMASVLSDTGAVTLKALEKGMHVTAVSHAETLKNIHALKNDSIPQIIKKMPKPVPVDEIKIMRKDKELKQNQKAKEEKTVAFDWIHALWIGLAALLSLVVLLFLTPWLIWLYLHGRAKGEGNKRAYYRYVATLYYLNQLGFDIHSGSPAQVASRIDARFGTKLGSFSTIYQKLKYSSIALNEQEQEILKSFYRSFIREIRNQVKFKERVAGFLNIFSTLNYFSKPKSS